MQQFPVTSSVLSDIHLGRFIQDDYLLDGSISCRLLKTFVNDTYLVTDAADKYIFRVYTLNWRSYREIAEELRLINVLKENNISVSYPIAAKDGDYIRELEAPEGKRYGVLFSFAVGEKIHNASDEIHYRIGELMGNIHWHTVNMKLERVTYDPKVLLIDSFEKFKSFLPASSDELTFMLAAQQKVLEEFKKADSSKLRQGAVHLDIWADNLHVDADNNIHLFDFDFCGNGWLCLDIAFSLLALYTGNDAEYKVKSESFLRGYESVTKITDEEKRMIPALGTALYFFYMGVQRERFSNVFFNEEHLKRYINLRIRKWYDHFCNTNAAI